MNSLEETSTIPTVKLESSKQRFSLGNEDVLCGDAQLRTLIMVLPRVFDDSWITFLDSSRGDAETVSGVLGFGASSEESRGSH